MCHICPTFADEIQAIQSCQEDVKVFDEAIYCFLTRAHSLEEEYRTAGCAYHLSNFAARESQPPQILDNMESLFEISEVEQYHNIFNQVDEMIKAATELRDQYYHSEGTVEEQTHRLFVELVPGVLELEQKYMPLLDKLEHDFECANDILKLSEQSFVFNSRGYRKVWHDRTGHLDYPVPAQMREEWMMFRDWIGSLPETQLGTDAGWSLDEVALHVLYGQPDIVGPELPFIDIQALKCSSPPKSAHAFIPPPHLL